MPMKKPFPLTMLVVASVVMAGPVALAQGTPDGETPANEGICDGLLGGTPGLYGLCVAYCEAQDRSFEGDPVLADEIQDLVSAGPPSGRILQKYNSKRQPDDPAMPCIVAAAPCPCWTAEELASVDGFLADGTPGRVVCETQRPPGTPLSWLGDLLHESDLDNLWFASDHENYIRVITNTDDPFGRGEIHACQYVNEQVDPDLVRNGSIRSGIITEEQHATCRQELLDAMVALAGACVPGF